MLVRFIKVGRCPAKDAKCEGLDFDKDDSSLPDTHKRRYSISRDRRAIWCESGAPLTGVGMHMSNSFGEQSMMTIARSIYKAPQQEAYRGGGYVLMRFTL